MKKVIGILLTVMTVLVMMSVMAVGVSAATYDFQGSTTAELDDAIADMDEGDTLNVWCDTLIFNDDDGQIDIGESDDNITVNFHGTKFDNDLYNGTDESFFEINGDHVTLNFDGCTIENYCYEICDDPGAVFYIDGDYCTINGNGNTTFVRSRTLADNGSFIYICNGATDCTITGCSFIDGTVNNLISGGYIYSSSDRCNIVSCHFDVFWYTHSRDVPCVIGEEDGQTHIINCDPEIGYDRDGQEVNRYSNCDLHFAEDIAEGEYVICTALDTNYNIDICCDKDGQANEANLHLYNASESAANKFYLIKDNGRYIIKSGYSGKVLDIAGESRANGANIYQYSDHSGDNQRWTFVPAGDGYYYIFSGFGTCMDVSGSSVANHANIHSWTYHGGTNQKFKLVKMSDYVGSALSEGNIWIIVAVAAVVVIGVAALFIVNKKKKPATANAAITEDGE